MKTATKRIEYAFATDEDEYAVSGETSIRDNYVFNVPHLLPIRQSEPSIHWTAFLADEIIGSTSIVPIDKSLLEIAPSITAVSTLIEQSIRLVIDQLEFGNIEYEDTAFVRIDPEKSRQIKINIVSSCVAEPLPILDEGEQG